MYTPVCDVLQIEHPIVQAGMARIYTNAELVAAVSNAGGLGVLGCLWRPPDEALAEIRRIHSLTDRPFGVNFVPHRLHEETFELCLAERVPVFCFFRGQPNSVVERAHAVGAKVVYQVTTVAEAIEARDAGAHVLVAQGNEAGGHMGPLPLLTLLPEVVAVARGRPVLAAGGIVDGRGLAAALCIGADGALMGTRFLATYESPIQPDYKQAILEAACGDTVASDLFDILWGDAWPGVRTRAIRNAFVERWLGHEDELRVSIEAIRRQRALDRADDDLAEMPLLAGAGAGRIRELKSAAQVVRDIVAEAEQAIHQLQVIVG
jgi:NAD(P)H-dependent flavin oxidoreductase YrpB (nitropropane dioxygenase family)